MRVLRVALVAVIAATMLVVLDGVATASASTTTLHFFGVGVRFEFTNPAGVPLGENDFPVAGDKAVAEADLFTGNHVRHGDRQVGTAHLFCTFTNDDGLATCQALLKVAGHGTLTGTDVTVDFNVESGIIILLNGGTGSFAGVQRRLGGR